MVQVIETEYAGYLFRSRLEARWAVLMDHLGRRWVYEKEEFDLDGEWYLPDFWLPCPTRQHSGAGYWLEVKPEPLTKDERRLLEKLVLGTGHHGMAFCGNIGVGEFTVLKCSTTRGDNPSSRWVEYGSTVWPYGLAHLIGLPGGNRNTLEGAFRAARSARFEHGEKGGHG
jgi:hypothetical protein